MLFKRIGFTSQCTLRDIDFFGSLPCGLVGADQGSDLLVQLLFRPQRPLFDACPLIGTRSALSLRPGISPCLSQTTMRVSSVPNPSPVCKHSVHS